jgi:small basic protein
MAEEVDAPPTTTAEQDRVTAGQRAVNLIWETTQMKIALSVIWGALLAAISLAIFGKYLGSPDLQLAAVVFIFGVANLVTGFYFGRTNHQRSGGVGGDAAGPR